MDARFFDMLHDGTDNDSLTLTIGNAETVEGSPLVYNLSLSNPSAQAQTYHLTAGTPGISPSPGSPR